MRDAQDEAAMAGFSRRTLLTLAAGGLSGAALGGAAQAAPPGGAITDFNALALSGAIRTRQVSCVEVMSAHLDQIERLNPAVNAIVSLQDRDDLLKQARACDDQLARNEPVGLLHGLPHAVKELSPVKGIRYTQGSPIYRDLIAPADALPVERLRAAGVIFIGKTNAPEFGLGSHTYNPVFGLTRNAYVPSKSAGGSTGGGAVALALRMVPLADGSDYGGSLRNPAGWNGVYGFRTSFGRVPVVASDAWTPSMGVVGPMARNVADLALLLSVQAGFDPRAPLSMESSGAGFRAPVAGSVRGKRIAWLGDFNGALPYEPGVLEVCRGALKTFEALGCVVEEAVPDYSVEKAWRSFVRLRGWQQGGPLLEHYRNPDHRPLLKPEAVYEVEVGLGLGAFDITADTVVRTEWSRAVRRLFQQYDYLVMPTAQVFPFDAEEHWPRQIAGVTMQTYHEWMKGVCLITLSGCPALAAPAGFSPAGLPMGIQIVAPVHQELACLTLAAAYEQAAGEAVVRRPALLTASGR